MKISSIKQKGFTLIELMVTVGIFVLMTGLILARYGSFNQGILLTNLAYDVALTIRSAQSYGLNVKSVPNSSVNFSNEFNYPFGVHFKKDSKFFILFADADVDGRFDSGEDISTTNIKRGSKVGILCVGTESSCDSSINTLDIAFKRPDPVAHIQSGGYLDG